MKTLKDARVGGTIPLPSCGREALSAPHHGYRHHQRSFQIYVRKVALGDPMELTV